MTTSTEPVTASVVESASRPELAAPIGAGVLHLRAAGVSVVLDASGSLLPRIAHWGADLGEVDEQTARRIAEVSVLGTATAFLDDPMLLGIVTEHSRGWTGFPGLIGHRSGRDWSTLFRVVAIQARENTVQCTAVDTEARLLLELVIELTPQGLLRSRAKLIVTPAESPDGDAPFELDGLTLTFPVPSHATELLDFAGRHLRERHPQRHPFDIGARVRETRKGRTGLDGTLLLAAGTPGFSFGSGEVWAIHVAWSGNQRALAERMNTGHAVLSGGELLLPGEITLGSGDCYTTPWIYGSYGLGLDAMASRFHAHLRARPHHPSTPRPVILNTWESVYFDQDLTRLTTLAQDAASIGVERYVLDDGWFLGRRDDTKGLGDWQVDTQVWPNGLHPLVDRVHELGMQFGLWVEPEMVNPDSHLARDHPEWVLSSGNRTPLPARRQQVVDLTQPGAYAHILDSLDALLNEYRIDYLKWDHNRDLLEAGRWPTGQAAVHNQTLATYAIMDELRRRHPGLEIESCASGGGRVDLGILEHTDRVWASDCIDALERQTIERYTGLLLAPELIGSHIGSAQAHTTGRRHDLSFRAGTAFFGHLGVEADVSKMTPAERANLAEWVAVHKSFRPLLHTGRVVRLDNVDPSLMVRGVISDDQNEAIFSIASIKTADTAPTGALHLTGLKADVRYAVSLLPPGDVVRGNGQVEPSWISTPTVLPGAALQYAGLPMPDLWPEQVLLLHLRRATQAL